MTSRPSLVVAAVAFGLVGLVACGGSPVDEPDDPPTAAASSALTSGARHGPSSAEVLEVARGERVGFSSRATDSEGDLWGAEWYLDGAYLGAQYVAGLPAASGAAATFWRGINFPSVGPHTVEVVPFDRAGHYAAPVRWRVQVGARPRLMYLDHTDAHIATPEGIAAVRAQVVRHGFDHVALYRLHVVLPDTAATARLRGLLRELRAAGVRRVFAVVGSPGDVGLLDDYLAATADAGERFDGMVSEAEFWRPETTWRDYLRLLAHMRGLADREGLVVATYLGWPEAGQIAAITGLVDLVFLHAYVGTPATAYAYLHDRLQLLAGPWAEPVTIWPIFSAEPDFFGPWLAASTAPDALEAAERRVLDGFRDDPGEFRNGVRLGGFAWFAASHLQAALD